MIYRVTSFGRRLLPLIALFFLVVVTPVVAQDPSATAQGLASQSMRPYRFVFYAYALAWIFVAGWVISIARRLARLSDQIGD